MTDNLVAINGVTGSLYVVNYFIKRSCEFLRRQRSLFGALDQALGCSLGLALLSEWSMKICVDEWVNARVRLFSQPAYVEVDRGVRTDLRKM